MRIESTGYSITGRRLNNEDSLVADERLGLFAVADGMGGREGGEVASRLAIDAIQALMAQVQADPSATWPTGYTNDTSFEEGLVETAVRHANRIIASRREGVLSHMGTTLALVLLRDGFAIIGHVGDSRVYRLRRGRLTQLTRDHSLYDDLKAAGATNLPPRNRFPYANVITRVLGDASKAQPDLRREPLIDGDVFLLCSDGLTESLAEERIAFVLSAYPAAEAARRLVREAFLRGANDNITAIVVAVQRVRSSQRDVEPPAATGNAPSGLAAAAV
jgi:PPM family protein phosphatase